MVGPALLAVALALSPPVLVAQACAEPYRVPREEILRAMSAHGPYSLTSTTTSMRFGAEALFAIVRQRQRESPGSTRLHISQADWFAAHLETAGVTYPEMSASARAAFEHHQDALVDYGPQVVERVLEGPAPRLALDVTIFWPDSAGAASHFSYRDTLSVPQVEVYDDRVVRFKLLEYDDMLLFDQIKGISVRPFGFLSAVFAVLGKPDLKQTRIAVSADQWQVIRGHVKVFPGIGKTGTATVEPGGRGHEGVPRDRADLRDLAEAMRRSVELRYGTPSCQAGLKMGSAAGASDSITLPLSRRERRSTVRRSRLESAASSRSTASTRPLPADTSLADTVNPGPSGATSPVTMATAVSRGRVASASARRTSAI
jgi:hypothetical protein